VLERKKKEKITQTLYTLKHLWTGGELIDTLNHVKKNMLIKTPINQWPLQSYSVTLSQLILKQNDQNPGIAIIILCYHYFFIFRVKKPYQNF